MILVLGASERYFGNDPVRRYGYEDVPTEVQDLHVEGRRAEAAAIPAELVDGVTSCGHPERTRERLAAYRDAGVGTLIVTPMAMDLEGRSRAMRTLASFL